MDAGDSLTEDLSPVPLTPVNALKRVFIVLFFAGLILTSGIFQSAQIIMLIDEAGDEADSSAFEDRVVQLLASSVSCPALLLRAPCVGDVDALVLCR
jgi:hypothetical protein